MNHQNKTLKINLFIFFATGVLLLGGFFIVTKLTQAVGLLDPVMNEVYIDGTDEWIEVLNPNSNSSDVIDLNGYKFLIDGGTMRTVNKHILVPPRGLAVVGNNDFQEGALVLIDTAGSVVFLKSDGVTGLGSVNYGGVGQPVAPEAGQSFSFDGVSAYVAQVQTKGWFNDAGEPEKAPLLSAIDASMASSGVEIESNIGELDNPSATPTTEPNALYFEKIGKGKIVFIASLNLSDQATVAVLQTLGAAMEMSAGHIKFDSTTADAMAATGAKIYMYGLDALGYNSQPNIIVKNDANETIDGAGIVSGIAYTSGGLNDGELSFSAAHFTQFDLQDPNTPPSFDSISDQNVNEDSSSQNITITNISPGPSGESSQAVTMSAFSSDPSIIPHPVVSGSGATRTLTYTPAADANGTVTITVTANDGQAENNTYSRIFSITVNPVVDADPDIALLAADKDALTDNLILGANSDLGHITEALTNPLPSMGLNGSNITWMSNEPRVSGDGTVIRPTFGEPDAAVIMTAQLSLGVQSNTKDFELTVLAETTDPDIAAVAADKEALMDFLILGVNSGLDLVTGSLSLPSSGEQGSTITWVSSNPSIVSDDGLTVVQPAFRDGDAPVTLTATILKGLVTDTKPFNITVLKSAASADTAITSEIYSIDIETIDNVAYGTSKVNFLAALAKNQAYQTWDSSGLSDPVAEDDQLVVTAEDETAVTTYTVSALIPGTPTNLQMIPSSPTNNNQPTLSWDPVVADPAITSYEVQINSDDDEISSTTSEVSYVVETPLNDHDYVWRVRACNESGVCSNWSSELSFTIDTVAPTVTELGNDTSDYQLPSLGDELFGATMTFSEKLSAVGRRAVEDALTAGADKALTFEWNDNNDEDGAELRISVGGEETATFIDDVIADVADLAGNTTIDLLLVNTDNTAPTVTNKLGDDSADVIIEAGDTNLYFSEALSDSSKTAVTNKLTAGANKELSYYWDDSYILRITATGTTTFANDVMVSVTDRAGNTATNLLIVDSALTATEVTPDESGNATVNSEKPEVVITNSTQAVNVTISSSTSGPKIDVSSFITKGTGVLPQITITSVNANNVTLAIPATTTVTSADSSWNGIIAAPTITTVTLPEVSGETRTLSAAIEVGFAGAKLSFDKAVRLLLPGQAGKRAGYVRAGTAFTEITSTCAADNQTTGDALVADGECKIDVGLDLVIWTKHFTSFATYSSVTTPASSPVVVVVLGGGGGGGYYAPTPTPTLTPAPAPAPALGQVLGVSAFRFTATLQKGSKGDDVMELQNRLTAEGVYGGPITGYFGSLTEAGVRAYQTKYGIDTLGIVGPITMAKLNGGQVLGVSTNAETEAKITALKTQLASLMTQLLTLLQKQAASLQAK